MEISSNQDLSPSIYERITDKGQSGMSNVTVRISPRVSWQPQLKLDTQHESTSTAGSKASELLKYSRIPLKRVAGSWAFIILVMKGIRKRGITLGSKQREDKKENKKEEPAIRSLLSFDPFSTVLPPLVSETIEYLEENGWPLLLLSFAVVYALFNIRYYRTSRTRPFSCTWVPDASKRNERKL